MVPLRNRAEDVGGVPDRNHDFRDLESMEAAEGWQRVAKTETAMKPIRNRPEDVGGAVDPNFARRDLDPMDIYEGWQRNAKSETAMAPLRNRSEDVGGVPDRNHEFRDLDSMEVEGWQRVAKPESAMAPLRNRREDVGGVPDVNHDFRGIQKLDIYDDWQRTEASKTALLQPMPSAHDPGDTTSAVHRDLERTLPRCHLRNSNTVPLCFFLFTRFFRCVHRRTSISKKRLDPKHC